MAKEAVFTLKLEPELRDQFVAEAQAAHRPASQVVRDMMREFIETQRQTRVYHKFLQSKVQIARDQREAGRHFADEDVEVEFAALRAELISDSDGTGV